MKILKYTLGLFLAMSLFVWSAHGLPGDIVQENVPTSGTIIMTQGTDVASANAMTLGDGNFFDITGVTTINSIASVGIGTQIALQFDGILQLTHSANLFLPTAANITTAAGDIAMFYEYASSDWRCDSYMRADGTSLAGSGGANKALDNLASVAVNESLISDAAGVDDLGSEPKYWQTLYLESEISFEGSTDNDFQTTISITDTTGSDKTVTIQDASGIVATDTTAINDLDGTKLSITTGTLNVTETDSVVGAITGAVAADGAGNIAQAAINDLSDATITSPTVDQVLRYNGVKFINGAEAVSGPGAGIIFYMDDAVILGIDSENDNEVVTLEKMPITTAEDQDDLLCTVANSPLQGESYLYDTALGGSTIDAGEWDFDTYAAVNLLTANRVSSLTRVLYHVVVEGSETIETTGGPGTSRTVTSSGGTPFASGDADVDNVDAGYLQTPKGLYQITAFTSGTVVTIEVPVGYGNESGVGFSVWKNKFSISTGAIVGIDPNFALYNSKTAQAEIAIAVTDKLAETVFAVCNNTTTVSYTHNGDDRYSHFHSPLSTRHNDMPGLNGGTGGQYYHSTSAEYTGSGTGVFARIDSPVFTTKIDISDGNITSVLDIEVKTISADDGALAMSIADSTGVVTFDATIVGSVNGNAGTVTNATLTTAITVNGQAVTITGTDQANTITLNESVTVGDGFNLTLTATGAAGSVLLDKQTFEVEGEGTATQLTKIVNANNAAATLTIEGTSAAVNQDTTSDASPTFAGVNLADGTLSRPELIDYGETVNNIGDFSGGAQDIDIELGNVVLAEVSTGVVTFSFTNPSASGTSCSFTLILTNGGDQTVNWPGAVDWVGGVAPTLTNPGVDVLTFFTVDAGTTWYGFAGGLDMQ